MKKAAVIRLIFSAFALSNIVLCIACSYNYSLEEQHTRVAETARITAFHDSVASGLLISHPVSVPSPALNNTNGDPQVSIFKGKNNSQLSFSHSCFQASVISSHFRSASVFVAQQVQLHLALCILRI